jgi:hypothetical protein
MIQIGFAASFAKRFAPCLLLSRLPAQAAQRCKAAGLLVVEGTCPAIELLR